MNSTNLIVLSGIVFGIGLIFELVTPPLFQNFVENKFNLLPGSALRKAYKKNPFSTSFQVYMFNVTNADEVTNGGKPNLQEIGPFFFEERRKNFDFFDDIDDDTLTYSYKSTFIFRPDLSGPGLSGNEIITMPHPLIATIFLALNVDKKTILHLARAAIDIIFDSPQHMFYTGRVMDILFDGIPIDCTSDEFQAQALCSAFQDGQPKTVVPIDDEHYAFSLFAAANGGEITVNRGEENLQDLGRVVGFNDEPEMDSWDGDECNQYRGTDSTIFLPPFTNGSDGIWIFEPKLCRSLNAHYIRKSKYMGIDTSEFGLNIGSPENTKLCYCRDKDQCPKNGTFDMFPCHEVPLIGSQPHFYGADPSLITNFASGINPEKAKHETYLDVEMTTGTLLSGAKRLQFNLEMVPIEDIPYMANLRKMYYPMFWAEERMVLKETYVNQISSILFILKTQNFLKWTGIIFGCCGFMAWLWHYMKTMFD